MQLRVKDDPKLKRLLHRIAMGFESPSRSYTVPTTDGAAVVGGKVGAMVGAHVFDAFMLFMPLPFFVGFFVGLLVPGHFFIIIMRRRGSSAARRTRFSKAFS